MGRREPVSVWVRGTARQRMKRGLRRRLGRAAAAGGLLACVALTLSSCSLLPYGGASEKGRLVHSLYIKTAIVAGIVLVGVIATLIVEMIAFRRRRGDDEEPVQDEGRPVIYGGFFLIGLVLIAALFPFSESTLSKVDDVTKNPDLRIMLNGSQWQWSAMYEKQRISVSGRSYKAPLEWELPVNKSVEIDLTSTDVIHGFYMPQFDFSKNAIPGVTNTFSFTPDRLGRFPGRCTQLCGVGHYQMAFVLKVVPASDFNKWVEHERQEAAAAKCGPPKPTLTVIAQNVSWNTNCISVPANQQVTVTMKNEDSGIEHNFSVYTAPDLKKNLFKGPVIKGPTSTVLHLPAMPPGTYYFQCDIHGQAMSGKVVVAPA